MRGDRHPEFFDGYGRTAAEGVVLKRRIDGLHVVDFEVGDKNPHACVVALGDRPETAPGQA